MEFSSWVLSNLQYRERKMNQHEIFQIICSAIIEVSSVASDLLGNIDDSKKEDLYFIDLGINSIDYAEIAHIVMGKLNLQYPLDIFAQTNNIKEASKIFHKLASSNSIER
jgi:acyl carrier protein